MQSAQKRHCRIDFQQLVVKGRCATHSEHPQLYRPGAVTGLMPGGMDETYGGCPLTLSLNVVLGAASYRFRVKLMGVVYTDHSSSRHHGLPVWSIRSRGCWMLAGALRGRRPARWPGGPSWRLRSFQRAIRSGRHHRSQMPRCRQS